MIGTGALAPCLIEAHATVRPIKRVLVWGRNFKKAQQVRTLIKEHTEELLASHDVLLMPSTTSLPKAIGEQKDPIQSYLSDRCTVLANLCGFPAISYPVHNIAGSAPLSMQLIAASKQDNYLLTVSRALIS